MATHQSWHARVVSFKDAHETGDTQQKLKELFAQNVMDPTQDLELDEGGISDEVQPVFQQQVCYLQQQQQYSPTTITIRQFMYIRL